MWPLAIFLMLVVLYWWLALCATIWCSFNCLMALWAGKFVRATIWSCFAAAGFFWFNQENWFPGPYQFDKWLKGSVSIVAFVACIIGFGKLCAWAHRLRRTRQETPPSLNINFEFTPSWDMGDCTAPERRDPGKNLVAADRIGCRRPRRAIGAKRSPRRISGPTIIY